MAGVWVLYEWGSSKGYGGGGTNAVVSRIFELVMALAMSCNIFLALLGAFFWIHAINVNSSHEDFFLQSVKPLSHLHALLQLTVWFVMMGLLLGIYLNLSPNWPETVIALLFYFFLSFKNSSVAKNFVWATVPLEIYHAPWWERCQYSQFRREEGREELKVRARARAQELKKRAYRERKKLDPSFDVECGVDSPVGGLLRKAAVNLGMLDCDSDVFEARLKEDWLFNVDQLKDMSCDMLSRYMPFGLARELHSLLLETGRSETI